MKDPFAVDDWEETPRHLLEKDIQRPCVAKARRAGWWARKFSSAPGNTAVPDYIFAKGGNVFFVEFKRPGGVATEKQMQEHAKMKKAGCIIYVCDQLRFFDTIMRTEELYAKELGRESRA